MTQAERQALPKLVIRKVIRAKREKVFEAWTKPELLEQWLVPPEDWTARSRTDFRVGGKYEQEMIVGGSESTCHAGGYKAGESLMHSGEYLEIKPPEKLVFTWNSPAVQNTRVTIELIDLGDSTEIWLTHELLPTEAQRESHSGGWNGALAKLERLLTQ